MHVGLILRFGRMAPSRPRPVVPPGPIAWMRSNQLRAMLDAEIDSSRPTPEFGMTTRSIQVEQDGIQSLEDQA